tara:strand:+ start:21916 stop:22569 length:654 start_codon:yes stop_codon:yes gene_type:complete
MALFSLQKACSVFGVNTVETLEYDVLLQNKNKEIRSYKEYIVAKVTVDKTEESDSEAFRILAGYIFGDNTAKQKIDMTSPVITQEDRSEKIAMTAPVLIEKQGNTKETMSFSMPSKYKMQDLPEPKDKRISFAKVPAHMVAAIRYSGLRDREKRLRNEKELMDWLESLEDYQLDGEAKYAGYNPPWTLPFFRRNEVLIPVKRIKVVAPNSKTVESPQ